MEQRAEAFLNAFGEIEQVLRRQLRAQASTTFSQLLIDATKRSPAVRQFEVDLREYAELRNAIVHQRTDGHAIAEPYVEVVRDIERIRDRLVRPPGLLPFAAQPVVTCEASDHIGSAALTAETITRWMAFTLRDNDGLLKEVPVADVLPHAETTDNVTFLGRAARAFDALGAFEEFFQRGQFPNAILLTEAGSTTQAPLGIVAVADIPQILASTR